MKNSPKYGNHLNPLGKHELSGEDAIYWKLNYEKI
jgi:hypothetical protein